MAKGSQFEWDAKKEEAAALLATGSLSNQDVANKVNVHLNSINNWLAIPEFKERIAQIVEDVRQHFLTKGIADLVERTKDYEELRQGLLQIKRERGRDSMHSSVPGWSSGLLCHEQKSLGGGELATMIDVYKTDTGLIKALLDVDKQASQDLGQWTEKKDVTTDGKPILVADI